MEVWLDGMGQVVLVVYPRTILRMSPPEAMTLAASLLAMAQMASPPGPAADPS